MTKSTPGNLHPNDPDNIVDDGERLAYDVKRDEWLVQRHVGALRYQTERAGKAVQRPVDGGRSGAIADAAYELAVLHEHLDKLGVPREEQYLGAILSAWGRVEVALKKRGA